MIKRLKLIRREGINLYLFNKLKENILIKSIKHHNNSHYSNQLIDKRRIKIIYNTTEYYLTNLCNIIKQTTTKLPTYYFYLSLERRLSSLLMKLKLFSTLLSAKQYISHGKVTINGFKINCSHYLNDLDTLTFNDKHFKLITKFSWLISIDRYTYIFRSYNYTIRYINKINIYNILSFYNKNN